MKKINIIILIILIISLFNLLQNKEKMYKAKCISKETFKNIEIIKQKDGYQLVKYQKDILIYIQSEFLTVPKNKCNKNEIPLFLDN